MFLVMFNLVLCRVRSILMLVQLSLLFDVNLQFVKLFCATRCGAEHSVRAALRVLTTGECY